MTTPQAALVEALKQAGAVVDAAYRMPSNAQIGNLMPAVSLLKSALHRCAVLAQATAPAAVLTPAAMKRGGLYNWKNQLDRLVYLRRFNGWHQFKKIGDPREVWCEVLDGDLHMLEETAPAGRHGDDNTEGRA